MDVHILSIVDRSDRNDPLLLVGAYTSDEKAKQRVIELAVDQMDVDIGVHETVDAAFEAAVDYFNSHTDYYIQIEPRRLDDEEVSNVE